MSPKFFEDGVGDVLVETLDESEDDVYAVNPGRAAVSHLVFRLHDVEDPPTVRLLVDWDEIQAAMDDFVVATHAADLVAADALDVRLLADLPRPSLFVSEESVVSLVHADDSVAGLPVTEAAFVADVWNRYDSTWETADDYRIRTPPLSEVRETLATDLGESVCEDLDALIAESPRVTGELDETMVVLLAAARHGHLFYDVSKWGEDIGFASKATFSQSRRGLENAGFVRTEKVPVDVGRPRLRLRLGERFRDTGLPDVVGAVASSC